MNTFTRSITKIFKGAMKSFETFPASMICAVGFALVTIVRIQLDWPLQQPYNFLFNCLHLSFAVGALFSLMAITAVKTIYNNKKMFIASNIIGITLVILTFLILYYFGGTENNYGYRTVTRIWAARTGVAMAVSMLVFIVLAGYPKERSDFSRSLFMTHKAFFIAFIYGAVIIAGASAVAGAIQALLYRGMSEKVYMYISTIGGFMAFAIFLGYFPDFRKGELDPHRDVAQTQPKFIKVLFGSIMVPLMLTLTVVLLLWAGKTVLSGMKASFMQLSGIATSFALGGIWLYMMITHYETGLVKFYKRVYPFAAIVILAFEAWALVEQLAYSGLKTAEYNFSLIWIVAIVAAVLLIIIKEKAYKSIVTLVCVVAIIAVFPIIGYHSMPVRVQVNRLERLLLDEGILKDGVLTPATVEPERSAREAITDAVFYLNYAENANLPVWYDKNLLDPSKFKDKLGFEATWPELEQLPGRPSDIMSTSLSLPNGAMDISNYKWVIYNRQYDYTQNNGVEIKGNKGLYKVLYTNQMKSGTLPKLSIELDGKVIIENDFKEFIDKILEKHPLGQNASLEGKYNNRTVEELSLKLESPEIHVMVVFSNIDVMLNVREDIIDYNMFIDSIYINEKP